MIRYLSLYRSICRTFGFRVRPLFTFLLLQLHRLINGTTRGLDHIFFPAIRKRGLDRPIFILGNPRSGTPAVPSNGKDTAAMKTGHENRGKRITPSPFKGEGAPPSGHPGPDKSGGLRRSSFRCKGRTAMERRDCRARGVELLTALRAVRK